MKKVNKMKKIFYLTGEIDSPFFINEIPYLTLKFDEVVVLSYHGDKKRCDTLSKKYNFTYEFVDIKKNCLETLRLFVKWIFASHVKEELKNHVKEKNGITKCLYVLGYGLFAIRTQAIINKYIKNSNAEIYLYSFWLSRFAYAISLYNNHRSSNIKKIISRAHGYDVYEERNFLFFLPFRKFIEENLDEIYFISKHGKTYFTNKMYSKSTQVSKKKISYLGTYNWKGLLKKEGDKEKIVFASCSNIIQVKRLDLIIEFLEKFPINDVKWIHIGDGELLEQIMTHAKENLSIEYKFYGKVNNNEILNIYATEQVDFFINLSDSEGIPVSIMEAFSMGIPVIARNVGGVSEAVLSGHNGILLEKLSDKERQFSDLSKDIIRIWENKEQYINMSKQAYKTWLTYFNANTNYTKFIEEILEKKDVTKNDMGVYIHTNNTTFY